MNIHGITFNEDYTKCQIYFRYKDELGNERQKKKTFEVKDRNWSKIKRKQELVNEANNYRVAIQKGLKGEVTTFNEFIEKEFWKECEKAGLSLSTIERYKTLLARIMESPIGKMNIAQIQAEDLRKFYDTLELEQTQTLKNGEIKKYKLSNRTILHHQKVVSVVLSRAKYKDYVKENVAERVQNIKVKAKETPTLQIEEIKELLNLLKKENIVYRTIIILIIYTGMRRSEVLALHWDDIIFESKILKVRRGLILTKEKGIIEKEPKTEKSIRDITLPESAIKLLKEYRNWQNMERLRLGIGVNTGRLFTNWTGEDKNMLLPDTVSAWFREFIAKSNLPKVTLHSLRHANITTMIAMGVDPKTASVRAGHSNTGITMDIYTHLQKSKDIIAAEKIDEAFA